MNQVAAVQMASGPNIQANLDEAAKLIDDAVSGGAKLVVLPENFALMAMSDPERVKHGEVHGSGPIQDFLSAQAKKHAVWLVGGTIPLRSSNPEKALASCLLFDDQGSEIACYHKIHMFDVLLSDNESYNESETTEAGDSPLVVDTPFGRLGLAVCYDLRFPELFRSMVNDGMDICALPAAFTANTGKAHWEPLIRARAIENQCYLIASAQGGYHINGRETHGDSMIVDHWGNIVDRLPQGSGVIVAELDMELLHTTRRNFPVLEHQRMSCHI